MASTENKIRSYQKYCLLLGLVGVACCIGLYLLDAGDFLRGYHIGFLFWFRLSCGFLGLALLKCIIKSHWGNSTWPYLRASLATVPVMAVLAVPVGLGLDHIFPWSHGDDHHEGASKYESPAESDESHDESGKHGEEMAHTEGGHGNAFQAEYLATDFFRGRMLLYFAVLLVAGWIAARTGTSTGEARWPRRLAAVGLMLVVMATTFAAFDWGMSLEPLWYSTIYGALMLVSGGLAAMAILVLSITAIFRLPRSNGTTIAQVTNDLGNLLLAFLMIWTYFSFSQYLIIWSGNLPSEVSWYLNRAEPAWLGLSILLVAAHFIVPFMLLLSREHKRRPRRLARIAGLLVVANVLENIWVIMPSYESITPLLVITALLTTVAVGAWWLYFAAAALERSLKSEGLLKEATS